MTLTDPLPRNGGLTHEQAKSFLAIAFVNGGVRMMGFADYSEERRRENISDYYRFMVGLMNGEIDPGEVADGKGAEWLAEAKNKSFHWDTP